MSNDEDSNETEKEFRLSKDLTQKIVDNFPEEEKMPRDAVRYYEVLFGRLDDSVETYQKGFSDDIASELIELSRLAYHRREREVVVARDFMHDELFPEYTDFHKEVYAELIGYAREMQGREIRNIGRLEVKAGEVIITDMPEPPEIPDLDELGDEGWTVSR